MKTWRYAICNWTHNDIRPCYFQGAKMITRWMDAKCVCPFQKYNDQITVKFGIVIDNKYRTTHRCGKHLLKFSFPSC
jgi:hypothetical protein